MSTELRHSYLQIDPYDCGAAALNTILKLGGIEVDYSTLRAELGTNPETGTDHKKILSNLSRFEQFEIGLVKNDATLEELSTEVGSERICLAVFQNGKLEDIPRLEDGHYGIVYAVDDHVHIMDPAASLDRSAVEGYTNYPVAEFLNRWIDKLGKDQNEAIFNAWMASIAIKGPQKIQ